MNTAIKKIEKLIPANSYEIKKNLKKYIGEIIVIKFGGSSMLDPQLSNNFAVSIKLLVDIGMKPIIVHGGGPQINEVLGKFKIKHKFFKGMRITDEKTFRVVEMVLSGSINKNIAYNISKKGVKAIGISGSDGSLLMAKKIKKNFKLDPDLGLVGRPEKLNKSFIYNLVAEKIVPVIAPIGFNARGQKLNINADLTAGFIASELNSRRLLMLTDVKGVIDKNNNLISELKLKEINKLIKERVIYGGMIPKVNTCVETIKNGVRASVIIDGRVKNAILKELLSDKGVGTLFRK